MLGFRNVFCFLILSDLDVKCLVTGKIILKNDKDICDCSACVSHAVATVLSCLPNGGKIPGTEALLGISQVYIQHNFGFPSVVRGKFPPWCRIVMIRIIL